MTIKAFNSIQGYSVGANPQQDIILANGDITTVNFTANGVSDLGPISNVKISGGSNGQVIKTDGTGNLTFADASGGNSSAPMPYIIPVGESYYVPENFQGLFTVPITIDGTFEVDGILAEVGTAINSLNGEIIYDNNGQLTGNLGFTFNPTTGNLAVPGSGTFTGAVLPSSNISYDLGSPTLRWKDLYLSNNTIYIGTSTISTAGGNLVLTNDQGGSLDVSGTGTANTTAIVNGNTNLIVNETSINFSANNATNVVVFTDTGANVNGNIAVTGILTNNYYYANGQPIDTQNPSGSNTQVQYNLDNNFGASANFTFDSATNLLNVIGNIAASNANLGNVVTANYLVSSAGCVTISGATIAVAGNNAGIFASLIDDINLGLAANIVMGGTTNNVTIQGNLISNHSISATGNVTGTLLTGTLTTGAQPNITSTGTLNNLTVSGNINTGNITVTNTVDAVNIKVTDLYSKRNAVPITTNTLIDSFPVAQFRSAKYTMRAGSDDGYQALEVLLVHNDINSIITVYGSLSTSGSDLVTFDTDISAGNVNVYANAVGANTNLNLMGTYVPD